MFLWDSEYLCFQFALALCGHSRHKWFSINAGLHELAGLYE